MEEGGKADRVASSLNASVLTCSVRCEPSTPSTSLRMRSWLGYGRRTFLSQSRVGSSDGMAYGGVTSEWMEDQSPVQCSAG